MTSFDTDLWVRDDEANLGKVVAALADLGAEWGASDSTFGPIPRDTNWLRRQTVYCLTSKAGAIDIFFSVRGLEDYETCWKRATEIVRDGLVFQSLSDRDMLDCQLALPEGERRLDRVAFLKRILNHE